MKSERDTVISQEVLSKIKEILKNNPKGMSVTDISKKMSMNRNSVAKYLDILTISGSVEMKSYGTAKVFFLSQRVPISAMVSFTSDLIVVLDGNHKIIQVNDAFLNFLQMNREDIVGKRFAYAAIPLLADNEIASRLSDLPPKKQFSTEITFGNGAALQVFRVKLVPTVFDDGGWGTTVICEDYTEERKSKEALQISEARYRAIVEDQPDLICRYRKDFTILYVNPALCRYFNRPESDFKGKSLQEFLVHDRGKRLSEIISTLTPERPLVTVEMPVHLSETPDRNDDQPLRWISWTNRGLFDTAGSLIEIQGTGRDITEQKILGLKESRLKQNLEFLERTATEFVDLSPDADIFSVISRHCATIAPESAIVISSYDRHNTKMVIRAVRDMTLPVDDASISSADLIGREFLISPSLLRLLAQWVHLEAVKPENASAVFQCIECGTSPKITAVLAQNFSYSISLISQGTLLGNFMFIAPRKFDPEERELIETYAHTAAGALRRRSAEESQKMSEERFRSVADLSPFPIAVVDPGGHYLYINRQFTEVFGYTLDDIPSGKAWFEAAFPDPDLRREAIEAWKADLSGSRIGLSRPRTFPVRCRDGRMREILFRPVTLADHNEYITYEDITDQKNADAELRAANQKMQDIIEFLPDPTFVIDTERRVLAWNRAMEDLTGVRREDMLGKGDYEYAVPFYGEPRPILIDIVDHEDSQTEASYRSVWREGDCITAEGFIPGFRGGTGVYLQGKASLLFNPKGERAGAIQSIRDLTQRKQMENRIRLSHDEMDQRVRDRTDELARANDTLRNEIARCNVLEKTLRTQEHLYHIIADSVDVYVFIMDRKKRLMYVNAFAAHRMGSRPEDLTGREVSELFPNEYLEKMEQMVHEVFESGDLLRKEIPVEYPAGEVLQDALLIPLKNGDGMVEAVIGITRDITER